MSRARRLTALLAVFCIGVAGLLSAALWVRELHEAGARFLPNPVVATAQGAVRPVEGRPLEWWGKTQRRTDRAAGSPAARALLLSAVLLAAGLAATADDRRVLRLLRAHGQERAPPLPLVH
jgi:hypothetical protein